jgi:phosphoribosylformylglycinamidine cyclo-ligase
MKVDASRILYEASKKTWKFRKNLLGDVLANYNDLSTPRSFDVSGTENIRIGMNSDGVGSKIEFAERLNKHDTIAYDLLAMVVDDAVSMGAEPLTVATVLDFKKINLTVVRQLAKGLLDACQTSQVSCINGEIAELGDRVHGFSEYAYNWNATLTWAVDPNKILDGKAITPGQSVVALREYGFRSNGFTLLRQILREALGDGWHENSNYAEIILQPSKIYAPAILDVLGRFGQTPKISVYGIAHITGGGIPLKFGRLLKQAGFGADLDNLFAPPDIMLKMQELGKVSDDRAYNEWNMGNGMLVVVDQPEAFIAQCKANNIEAQLAGKITKSAKISLASKGLQKKKLSYSF